MASQTSQTSQKMFFQISDDLGLNASSLDRGVRLSRPGHSDNLYCSSSRHWHTVEWPVLAQGGLRGAYEMDVYRYLLALNEEDFPGKVLSRQRWPHCAGR